MAIQRLQAPVLQDDFTTGMIDDLSVGQSLFPKNAVRKAVNVMFDRPRGAITQRNGTTQLGGDVDAGSTITGLHNHRSSTAANHKIFSVVGGQIYILNSSTWDTSATLGGTGKTRFITFLDSTAAMQGGDVRAWNESSWLSTGGALDVGNFPDSRVAVELNTRLFTFGDASNPDTVTGSSLEAGGSISWTSGTKSFKVAPNDGNGNLTSAISNGRVVIFFKERGMYRYDDNELQRVVDIGTTSHESVFNDDNGITYFFGQGANTVGFYTSTGGYPVKLSRSITKWVEAISASFYTDINGYTDGTKCYWNVGSVTVDSVTYTNAQYVYSIADRTWEIRDYADRFMVEAQYIDTNSNVTTVGGDTDGMIQTIDSGTTDNGTPISSECELAPMVFTTRGRIKVINELVAYAQDFQGLQLFMKVDNGEFDNIGSIDDTEKRFKEVKFRGHKFYPKITAYNSQAPFVFEGLEYPDVQDEGYQ